MHGFVDCNEPGSEENSTSFLWENAFWIFFFRMMKTTKASAHTATAVPKMAAQASFRLLPLELETNPTGESRPRASLCGTSHITWSLHFNLILSEKTVNLSSCRQLSVTFFQFLREQFSID